MSLRSTIPTPPLVMSLAGSDPTGGAGVQADILTLASLGCHPVSVVTAITVQDSHGVAGVQAVAAEWVTRQAQTVLEDMPVAAFKVGLVASVENIAAIAGIAGRYPGLPLVLDPVLASGRGDALASASMVQALRTQLLPCTTVLTPNSVEARRLAGGGEAASLSLAECARVLLADGARYVLITGTHEASEQVENVLYGPGGEVHRATWPRLPGCYHGSGCTLASAIAGYLARGCSVPEAVQAAQAYTWQALAQGFAAGSGQLFPRRFFAGQERQDV